MRWFRVRQQLCGWIALLALALQLALSFGHVHGLPTGGPTAVAAISDGSSQPSQPSGADHDDDYCAICAVLALLSSSQTASAPVLPAFVAVASVEIAIVADEVSIGRSHHAFRSRAPPIS